MNAFLHVLGTGKWMYISFQNKSFVLLVILSLSLLYFRLTWNSKGTGSFLGNQYPLELTGKEGKGGGRGRFLKFCTCIVSPKRLNIVPVISVKYPLLLFSRVRNERPAFLVAMPTDCDFILGRLVILGKIELQM